ncbi:MAG: arylsulfatase [Fuerstiella sp.]|nr:arylsulfatase [Fuerstiella sp.]
MNKLILPCTVLFLLIVQTAIAGDRPNVLIIMVDDLGFSDIGCYGSEIETPNLDRLASSGLRFSQFYNTAKCHSSRISLLTGCYALQAGNMDMSNAVTSAEVLKQAGYTTLMTGKWHLKKQPTDFGFDRYFGHLSGACNYFKGDNTFRLNGQPWKVPNKGFYTTVADVDFGIKFLQEARKTDRPWYLYVAFNAPHAPLQPLEVDYRKYMGRYDTGWDTVRATRLKKQAKLDIFGKSVTPSPRPQHIPAWDTLSEKRRDFETKRMMALAGMIDRVDQEVGRLVKNLEEAGELDNTMLLFVSDNGACPYDRRSDSAEADPFTGETRWGDSTGWAWARNSPFRYYKQNQFEGGIGSPAIVHWPAGLKTKPGAIVHTPAHLVDVLPTIAELGKARIPTTWPEREVRPISGVSLVPILKGQPLNRSAPIHLLFGDDRGLRDGDWKAVSFKRQPWELYNIASDRTEISNVASAHPERMAAMVRQWTDMAEHVLHTSAGSRRPVDTKVTGHHHREWTNFAADPDPTRTGFATEASRQKPARNGTAGPQRIRARKDTRIEVRGNDLVLDCTGTDSGIAIERLEGKLPAGPYTLSFRIKSNASGSGEVYFSTDPRTSLPRGTNIQFEVKHDGQWHDIVLELKTSDGLHALRIDPCSGPGMATLTDLTLRDPGTNVIARWPAQSNQ